MKNSNFRLGSLLLATSLPLLLLAGVYNNSIIFNVIPGSGTVIITLVSISAILAIILFEKETTFFVDLRVIVYTIIASIFISFYIFSNMWSPSNIGASYKTARLGLAVLCLIGGILIGLDSKRRTFSLKILCIFGIVVSVGSWVYLISPWYSTVSPFGSGRINSARAIGASTIILIYYYLSGKRKSITAFGLLSIILMNITTLLFNGTRTPMIAAIFAGAFITVFHPMTDPIEWVNSSKRIFLSIVLLAIPITLYKIIDVQLATISRLRRLVDPERQATSLGGRFELYADALSGFAQSPVIGNGISSFSILRSGADTAVYPHNIFLEAMVEMGIVGTGFLLIIVFYPILVGLRTMNMRNIAFLALQIFALINGLLSGSIPGNRILFFTSGVLLVTSLSIGRHHSHEGRRSAGENSLLYDPDSSD